VNESVKTTPQGLLEMGSAPAPSDGGFNYTPLAPDEFEAKLQEILERVRPFIQMDGGDLELIAVEDRNALIRMHGACVGCPSSIYTLKLGVEEAIRKEIPDFGELIEID
jgi:Fe-S cluster biogenesis protein NfuA